MSYSKGSGPRKIPDEELKFGLSLRSELFFNDEAPIDVIIVGKDDLDEDQFHEVVSSTFSDESLRKISGPMLSATIQPPDIRSQLIGIAAHNEVTQIIIDEQLMIPTIPVSYFR